MNPGDVVKLKGGGPWMTVTLVNSSTDSVNCMWFDPLPQAVAFEDEVFTGPPRSQQFAIACLAVQAVPVTP